QFLAWCDLVNVPILLWILLGAGLAAAESHPSWWGLASPDATAIVGIRWEALERSAFGPAIEAELSGSLGFPQLPILRQARQILISSPGLVALATGPFPPVPFRPQPPPHPLNPPPLPPHSPTIPP